MEASIFINMLSDKYVTNLKKLGYKYPDVDMQDFIDLLRKGTYYELPLKDFEGNHLVYMANVMRAGIQAIRTLLTPHGRESFGLKAMEEEISSTLTIENIDFSRDSVRKILGGHAPSDQSEERIYGMKRGLEFIADPANTITEENIHELYHLAIETGLEEEDRLLPGAYYRHDQVYVVGSELEHTGISYWRLPEYVQMLVSFIGEESELDDLSKAAVIHFYIGYLHPWFDVWRGCFICGICANGAGHLRSLFPFPATLSAAEQPIIKLIPSARIMLKSAM